MPRQKNDPTLTTQTLARLYAKYFANDEDVENNLKIEHAETVAKQQFPKEYRRIERDATNLALGHKG